MNETKHHIFLTGSTGYIGKHITLLLLQRGYNVTASMRNRKIQEPELRQTLSKHFHNEDNKLPSWESRLFCVELDLSSDESTWREALSTKVNNQCVSVLIHLASPCPVKHPKTEDEVIQPAVLGATKAVESAYAVGINRIIVTSSVAAVVNVPNHQEGILYTAQDWSDTTTNDGLSAYVKAKTLAEKKVWDVVHRHPELQVTTILPSFVLGAPLDSRYGPSVHKIHKLMFGKSGVLPNYGYSCVDVEDIALLHVRAMERPDLSVRKRFIGSARCWMWVPQMAKILHDEYPELNIPHEKTQSRVVIARAEYDPSFRYIVLNLDRRRELDNCSSKALLGKEFRDPHQSLLDTASFLISRGKRNSLLEV